MTRRLAAMGLAQVGTSGEARYRDCAKILSLLSGRAELSLLLLTVTASWAVPGSASLSQSCSGEMVSDSDLGISGFLTPGNLLKRAARGAGAGTEESPDCHLA